MPIRSVSSEPFITAAVARGESPAQIVRWHMLRNAAIPVLTVAATSFGYLLGGTAIVEQLFSLPGVGSYLLSAVLNRDYAVVVDAALLGTTVFVTLNMAADLTYVLIDPRVGRRRDERG